MLIDAVDFQEFIVAMNELAREVDSFCADFSEAIDFRQGQDHHGIWRDTAGRFASPGTIANHLAKAAAPTAIKVAGGAAGAAIVGAIGEQLGGPIGREVGAIAGKIAGDTAGRVTGSVVSAALSAKEKVEKEESFKNLNPAQKLKTLGAATLSEMESPEFKEKLRQAMFGDLEGTGVGKVAAAAIKSFLPEGFDLPDLGALDAVSGRVAAAGGAIAAAATVGSARSKIRGKA